MSELISVIIPVYNSEKFIDRCMESILNQTYGNLEIILVDDGSKDDSLKCCNDYADRDSRVKVFHKENGGSSSARNLGVRNATGKYIGFVDSDDYIEPDMYESLASVFDNNTDAVIAQMQSVNRTDEGELVSGPFKDSGEVVFLSSHEMYRQLLTHVGDSSFCTKLIKADFMKDHLFPEGKMNEDFRLLFEMLTEVTGVYSFEKIGYNIMLREGSNTRNVFKPLFYNSLIENSDFARDYTLENMPDLHTEAQRFWLFQRLDYMLHIPVKKMKTPECRKVLRELKDNRKEIKENPLFSPKERRNLKILSRVPHMAKRAHGVIMFFKRLLKKA